MHWGEEEAGRMHLVASQLGDRAGRVRGASRFNRRSTVFFCIFQTYKIRPRGEELNEISASEVTFLENNTTVHLPYSS